MINRSINFSLTQLYHYINNLIDHIYFKEKEKAYQRTRIEELETNSKNKNIRDLYRGINDFKKVYKPRCNIVKDEKGHLVDDSHSIVARWRNFFSQLFKMMGRQKSHSRTTSI